MFFLKYTKKRNCNNYCWLSGFLPWGPGEEAAAYKMAVNMIDCLASVGFTVDHKTPAFFFTAGTFGKFLGFEKQLSHELCVGGVQFHNVLDMFFRNHKKMHRRLRIQVMESQEFLIFVHLIGRNLPIYYLAKNTVFHDSSITEL